MGRGKSAIGVRPSLGARGTEVISLMSEAEPETEPTQIETLRAEIAGAPDCESLARFDAVESEIVELEAEIGRLQEARAQAVADGGPTEDLALQLTAARDDLEARRAALPLIVDRIRDEWAADATERLSETRDALASINAAIEKQQAIVADAKAVLDAETGDLNGFLHEMRILRDQARSLRADLRALERA